MKHWCTYQLRGPVEIALAHRLAYSFVSGGRCDKKATVAHVAASTWIIWLNVKASQADFVPVHAIPLHLVHGFNSTDVAEDHYCAKIAEPVRTKSV
jgi:hypothetical protein